MRKRGSIDSLRDSVPSTWRAFHMPPSLRHEDGAFTNTRGQSLSYLALFPAASTPLRGIVLYIHSFSVHARRYFHVYEQLCEHGFGVLAYDLLGHGESDSGRHGMRAHAEKFQYFVDDTNEFITVAKQTILPPLLAATALAAAAAAPATEHDAEDKPRSPLPPAARTAGALPLILLASSYGTLVALHTLLSQQHTFDAVVLTSPSVMVEWRPLLRLQALFVRPMAKLLPKLRAVPAVKPEMICRDPAFLEDYYNDPLTVADNMTLRMGAQSLKACEALQKETLLDDATSAVCAVPMLFLLGSADRVTSVALAIEFFERMRSRDKELRVFDGMYHALFDDPERDEVFAHLLQWLEARFPVVALGHADEKEAEQPSSDARAAVA